MTYSDFIAACNPAAIRALLDRLDSAERNERRYQLLRRGQHWSVINGIGDTLRADDLDAAIDEQLRSVPRDEWRALHAALSSQGAGEAAQPARVVDERDAALNLIMKMCNDAKEPCSTDPESAGAIRNGKFASIAGVAAQGLGLIRGPSLSTPPAAPTTSQQADGWATARAQDSSDYSREHLTDEPQAGAVTELDGVKRWFMNPETGMLVQTERGPWVRYVDVLAAFEAKKAGGV